MGNNTDLKFGLKVYLHNMFINTIATISTFFFMALFLMLRQTQILYSLSISMLFYFLCQFTIDYFLTKKLTGKLENDLMLLSKGSIETEEERTEIYKKLIRIPPIKSLCSFCYFIILLSVLTIIFIKFDKIGIDSATAKDAYPACIYCSIIASLFTYNSIENICNPYLKKLVADGIDEKYIFSKNFFGQKRLGFGLPLSVRSFAFLFVPVAVSNIMSLVIINQAFHVTNGYNIGVVSQNYRFILFNLIFLTTNIILVFAFRRYLNFGSQQHMESTKKLLEENSAEINLDSTLGDQIQYNIYLLVRVIENYNFLMNKLTKIGQDIFSSTGELSIIASEISESSNSQNADVKESLATMEDSYSLSKNISSRITEVSGGTDNTKYEVSEAFYLLKENIEQLTEINTSNMEFKEGIDRLSKQIESVDDIVSIIKDIADQTKIIAFNAELEAISAGKEGQNFHIVSTEIRRLANNTMNSIDTIKEYIANVKQSSTSLLESSITNSYKITEEIATARELEQQFDQIKKSSNLTNSKSNEITSIIEQQTVSFNQIVITLRQISAGLESFTVSTKTINNAVEDMKNIAHKLSGIN